MDDEGGEEDGWIFLPPSPPLLPPRAIVAAGLCCHDPLLARYQYVGSPALPTTIIKSFRNFPSFHPQPSISIANSAGIWFLDARRRTAKGTSADFCYSSPRWAVIPAKWREQKIYTPSRTELSIRWAAAARETCSTRLSPSSSSFFRPVGSCLSVTRRDVTIRQLIVLSLCCQSVPSSRRPVRVLVVEVLGNSLLLLLLERANQRCGPATGQSSLVLFSSSSLKDRYGWDGRGGGGRGDWWMAWPNVLMETQLVKLSLPVLFENFIVLSKTLCTSLCDPHGGPGSIDPVNTSCRARHTCPSSPQVFYLFSPKKKRKTS